MKKRNDGFSFAQRVFIFHLGVTFPITTERAIAPTDNDQVIVTIIDNLCSNERVAHRGDIRPDHGWPTALDAGRTRETSQAPSREHNVAASLRRDRRSS